MILTHVIAGAGFAGLVIVAGAAAAAERSRRRRTIRMARHGVIAYVIAVTCLAGLSQRDLWPLSSWALMTGPPRRDIGVDPLYLRIMAVDSTGREYPIDYRAVEPFAIEELMAWMRMHFLKLPPADRDSAAAYVLARLNAARVRVLDGQAPGTHGRLLGPLRAPFHTLHPRTWTGAGDVPATAFVSLRVYAETWDLDERARDPSRVVRALQYEYRTGPTR